MAARKLGAAIQEGHIDRTRPRVARFNTLRPRMIASKFAHGWLAASHVFFKNI